MPSLAEFLEMFRTPNFVTVATGVVLYFILDFYPQFESLAPRIKRIVAMALSFLLPLIAWAVSVGLGYAPADAETVWQFIAAGGMAFLASQGVHAKDLASTRG